jgi:RimJ/RimL family protein N-acetyltransferase
VKLIYGNAIVEWVADHLPHVGSGGFRIADWAAIGLWEGEILCGVVYNDHGHGNIEMGIYTTNPRWCSRSNLRVFFQYPFVQLQARRVTVQIPKRNRHARRFVERLGFVLEGNVRQGFGSDDCIIYGMLSTECRWIGDLNGQEIRLRTASA